MIEQLKDSMHALTTSAPALPLATLACLAQPAAAPEATPAATITFTEGPLRPRRR